jgi:hypothetical protein
MRRFLTHTAGRMPALLDFGLLMPALLALALLAGCGAEEYAPAPPGGYGSIAVQAVWGGQSAAAPLDAGGIGPFAAPGNVSVVRVIIDGPGMARIRREFLASDGGATIDKVPAGTDRTLTLQGLGVGSVPIWEGTYGAPFPVNEGAVSSLGVVTMAPLDIDTGFAEFFQVILPGPTPTTYNETPDGTAPSGFDPLLFGTTYTLGFFPVPAPNFISVERDWDAGSEDYTGGFTIAMDIDSGPGIYPITTAGFGEITYTDPAVPADVFKGGPDWSNSSGTVTIDLFGAYRVVGSYVVVLDLESSPGTTLAVSGSFDLKQNCDFFLPVTPVNGGCPRDTPFPDLPTVTGDPTGMPLIVLDGETFGVTVPVNVPAGALMPASLILQLSDDLGNQVGSGGASLTAGTSGDVVVPVTLDTMNSETGNPIPAGTYPLRVLMLGGNFVDGPFSSSVLFFDPSFAVNYAVFQAYFLVPNVSSTMEFHVAPTAIAGVAIEKGEPGYAAMNGVPVYLDAPGGSVITTLAKGNPVTIEADLTGLAEEAAIWLTIDYQGGSLSKIGSWTANPEPGSGTPWTHSATFTIALDEPLGAWVAAVHLRNAVGSGADETWYSEIGSEYYIALKPGGAFVLGENSGKPLPILTVTGPPAVISGNPVGTGATSSSIVTALFDADMLASTIDASTFTVTHRDTATLVPGTVGYDAPSRTATFTPDAPFTVLEWYDVSITSAVTDVDLNPITPAAWDFIPQS